MNDVVLTVKTEHSVKGDISAFDNENKIYIKRVIAVGGDTLSIDQNGKVSVNGPASNESYVIELSLGNCDIQFPFQVPEGTYFVLGDNRPTALDSRESTFGTIGRDQIIGKVIF